MHFECPAAVKVKAPRWGSSFGFGFCSQLRCFVFLLWIYCCMSVCVCGCVCVFVLCQSKSLLRSFGRLNWTVISCRCFAFRLLRAAIECQRRRFWFSVSVCCPRARFLTIAYCARYLSQMCAVISFFSLVLSQKIKTCTVKEILFFFCGMMSPMSSSLRIYEIKTFCYSPLPDSFLWLFKVVELMLAYVRWRGLNNYWNHKRTAAARIIIELE